MKRLIVNAKTGFATASSTVAISTAEVLNWIPDDIGKLGALTGIVLSSVLIIVHICKCWFDSSLAREQLKKLKRENEELNGGKPR